MAKRLATVVWWIGTVLLGFALVFAIGLSLTDRVGSDDPIGAFLLVGIWVPLFYSAAYVLGGSFWRPATGPLSKQ